MLPNDLSVLLNPRQLVRLSMAAGIPRRLFMVSGPKASRRVTLTFDDGPHPEYTPVLLDRLKERNVPATFFVLGRQAERYPDIVRRMAAEGHDVGHHSFTHSEPSETSARKLLSEARQTRDLLTSLIGHESKLFRPPHGKITAPKAVALWKEKQSIVLWNQDPKDFSCGSTDALRSWFQEHTLSGGDIILLHDVHPYAGEAMDVMVEQVAAAGLAFGRVSDWVFA